MTKLIIDGIEIEADPNLTLLQACEQAGAEIPRFCYHERLSIAGNCRMCLVEWVGAPKPQASCALNVKDLRPDRDGSPPKINTASPTVKKAREGVMEFLLINHPLDCPICDQGGECDLQDQAMAYGRDSFDRFDENKRAVEDKYMGPVVKTSMTRCIQCTRCVRFMTEVAGVPELGLLNRGENAEITTYLEEAISSELSGNIVDLCPVGALTSKPYAFEARPWELRKTETIDVMDAVGSNIRVDARGREVKRILPRLHEDVNEEWISDKTRHVADALGRQRLDRPYVRGGDGKLKSATWDEAFDVIKSKLDGVAGAEIGAIAGDLQGVEGLYSAKQLLRSLDSSNTDCRQSGAKLGGARGSYLFNTTIAGIEDADAILLVGTNPRKEATVLNARIRKSWLAHKLEIMRIGEPEDLTYEVMELGNNPADLAAIAEGRHDALKVLKDAERPMIIIGESALARPDGAAILHACAKVAEAGGVVKEGWNGFNVLHAAAARVGGLDIGFLPADGGKDVGEMLKPGALKVLFLLGADEVNASASDAFKVYLGSHGDRGAHVADVILPAAAYTEQDALYVNTEGRVQAAMRAAFPPGDAKADWAIFRALSAVLSKTLPFDTLEACRAQLFSEYEHLAVLDEVPSEAVDLNATGQVRNH